MKLIALADAALAALVIIAAASCEFAFAGCARADRTFRTRVESVQAIGSSSYDPMTGAITSSGGITLHFRPPAP